MRVVASRASLLWCALACGLAVSVLLWLWLAADRPSPNAEPTPAPPAIPGEAASVSPEALPPATSLAESRESVELAPAAEPGPAGSFFGLVQLADGTPSPRTRVAVYEGCTLALETETDAEGYFQVELQPGKSACALVHFPELCALRVNLASGHATRATAQRLELGRWAAMLVRVRDATGRPLPGLTLQFATGPIGADGPDHRRELQVTGVDGCALLAGIPAQPVVLDIWSDREHLRREVGFDPRPGSIAEWESVLGSGARLGGIAMDQNAMPIERTAILLCGKGSSPDRSAFYLTPADWIGITDFDVTDAAGRFEFLDVIPGTWWLVAQGDSGAPFHPGARIDRTLSSLATPVEVLPTDREIELQLRIHRGLTIEGRVLAPDGTALAGHDVLARGVEYAGTFTARTNDDGHFSIQMLSPGAFDLHARAGAGWLKSRMVRADAGEKDVVLNVSLGVVLAGRVFDHGEPAGATLTIWTDAGPEPTSHWVSTTGIFTAHGLPGGDLTLVARGEDDRIAFKTLTAQAGDRIEDLELVLEAGTTLILKCETPGSGKKRGQAIVRSGSTVVGWVPIASMSLPRPLTVPRGLLEVSFTPEEGPALRQMVTAVPGIRCELTFQVP